MAKMNSCMKNDTIKKILHMNLAKSRKNGFKKRFLVTGILPYDAVQQFLQNKKKNCQKSMAILKFVLVFFEKVVINLDVFQLGPFFSLARMTV